MSKLTDDYTRQLIDLVIIDIDQCANIYGLNDGIVSFCQASAGDGQECVNSFHTCQDKANYIKGAPAQLKTCNLNTIPFPGEDIYEPILEVSTPSPTEIDDNKTIKARLKFTMVNSAADSLAMELLPAGDRYARNKSSFSGTRLRKLLSRHPNLKGRPVRRYLGALGDSLATFMQNQVFTGVIYDFKQGTNGDIMLEAEDLLAKLEETFIPPKSEIKLVADITISDVQLTVSDASILPAPPNYIFMDKELIKYEGKNDTTGVLSTLTRGAENTTAKEHSANSKIQECQFWDFQSPFDIMQSILTIAGYSASDIDTDAFDFWKDYPETDINYGAIFEVPTKASALYFELIRTIDGSSWVGEDLKITVRRNIQNQPGRVYTDITESGNIKIDTQKVDKNLKGLRTRATMAWDRLIGEKPGELDSYNRANQFVDADAESSLDLDEVLEDTIFSNFIKQGDTAEENIQTYVNRVLSRRIISRNSIRELIDFNVEIRDYQIKTGEWVEVTTDAIEDSSGAGLDQVKFQVMRRTERGPEIGLKVLRIPESLVGFWGTEEMDGLEMADATAAQKEYAFWANDDGKVPDGSQPGAGPYTWY